MNALMEFEHEEALRSIQEFLSDCAEQGLAKTEFQIPFKVDVFRSRHNQMYLVLGSYCRKWFENIIKNEDIRIFEWHIDLWAAAHLHPCMQKSSSNPKRIQFVSSKVLRLSSYIDKAAANRTRINAFFEVMKENPAQIYLCPYVRDSHWLLLVFIPEASQVYYFDSAARARIDPFCHEFVKEIMHLYDTQLRINDNEDHTWKLTNIAYKIQRGNWKCGYYVMRYMEKIAFETKGVDILTHFPRDDDEYSREEIDALVHRLFRLFVQNVIPVFRKQLIPFQVKILCHE